MSDFIPAERESLRGQVLRAAIGKYCHNDELGAETERFKASEWKDAWTLLCDIQDELVREALQSTESDAMARFLDWSARQVLTLREETEAGR